MRRRRTDARRWTTPKTRRTKTGSLWLHDAFALWCRAVTSRGTIKFETNVRLQHTVFGLSSQPCGTGVGGGQAVIKRKKPNANKTT